MRITTTLHPDHVRALVTITGLRAHRFAPVKGELGTFTLTLSGHAPRSLGLLPSDYYGPTWDETMIFLGLLFDGDPDAWAVDYRGALDFHWRTGDRYRPGNRIMICEHAWSTDPVTGFKICIHQCGSIIRPAHDALPAVAWEHDRRLARFPAPQRPSPMITGEGR